MGLRVYSVNVAINFIDFYKVFFMYSFSQTKRPTALASYFSAGPMLLLLSFIAAFVFFWPGVSALLVAWQLPEYSHGPLIPVLSLILFLRHLTKVPVNTAPVKDYWPGVVLLVVAIFFGVVGNFSQISEITAYGLIIWVGATTLIAFGWHDGKQFWPPVLHLIYMLPLPGIIYYKLSTFLQGVSSELGVWMLQLINVPVYLEGNIIDLGVYKLHVAEACSGLRYLFPIMSFSYVFAVLFRGAMWHKAILLLAAVPITVFMNSVRIAFAGWLVNYLGLEYLEGFSHFFEGWVIFMLCVLILFALAAILLRFQPEKMSLLDALDVDTTGWAQQLTRLRFTQPTRGLILSIVLVGLAAALWQMRPAATNTPVSREPFLLFPTSLGAWDASIPEVLDPSIAAVLGADDYHSIYLKSPTSASEVGLFIAWYEDQTKGGTHSPEICLPSAGWEIAELERIDVASVLGAQDPFNLNRVIIQKGENRMLVYYWFEQHGRHVAWDFAAKMYLLLDGVTIGRTDGALVRLTTLIGRDETEEAAEERLRDAFIETMAVLPRFVPGD